MRRSRTYIDFQCWGIDIHQVVELVIQGGDTLKIKVLRVNEAEAQRLQRLEEIQDGKEKPATARFDSCPQRSLTISGGRESRYCHSLDADRDWLRQQALYGKPLREISRDL